MKTDLRDLGVTDVVIAHSGKLIPSIAPYS